MNKSVTLQSILTNVPMIDVVVFTGVGKYIHALQLGVI